MTTWSLSTAGRFSIGLTARIWLRSSASALESCPAHPAAVTWTWKWLDGAVGGVMGRAALDEERRCLQLRGLGGQVGQRPSGDSEGVVGAHVGHEVGADEVVAGGPRKRQQGETGALDRARGQHDDAACRDRDGGAATDVHGDDPPDSRLHLGLELRHVTVGHHHHALEPVVPARLGLRPPGRFRQQGHRAERVDRTGPGARRTALHGQRGFELQQVLVHHVGNGVDVQWEIGQRDRVGHRSALDAVEDLLAQRLVQGAEHEVVRLGDAHLLGCLAEVRLVAWDRTVNPQFAENPLGPHVVRRLGLGQLRGPPSPEHRATAQAVGEAGEADGHVRPPRKTPHLGSGHPGVRRRGRRGSQTHAGQVLDVLAHDVGPGVEDQDAVVAAADRGRAHGARAPNRRIHLR